MSIRFTGEDLAALRTLVRRVADGAAPDARVDDLVLVVNELVTNAVRHGGGRGEIAVERRPEGVAVDIRDHGPGLPPVPAAGPPPLTATGGRGLWLARRLFPDLTIASTPHGLTVRLFLAAA